MAIRVQTEFIRKDTVRCICYTYNDAGVLANATSVDITIKDPDGTVVVDETAMNNTGTGVYEYYYTTTASVVEGDYLIECDITDGSYHSYVHGNFIMVAGINE